MSPGIRRISKKTSAAAPTRVGITSRIRFTMYRYIASALSSLMSAKRPVSVASFPVISLFVEPHGGQVLIEVVARADLPALDVRPMGDDPVPPQHRKLVRFTVDHVLLELAHQGALLGRVGLVQHFLIEVDLLLVVIVPVILGEDRGRKCLLDVEERVDHALAAGFEDDVEISAAHRLEPRTRRHDALARMEPDLAPLVDEPRADIFVGLID